MQKMIIIHNMKNIILNESGRRFSTNFNTENLELYQHAIVGMDAEIYYINGLTQKVDGYYSLWINPNCLEMFWKRCNEMKRRKDVGEQYWMLIDY